MHVEQYFEFQFNIFGQFLTNWIRIEYEQCIFEFLVFFEESFNADFHAFVIKQG